MAVNNKVAAAAGGTGGAVAAIVAAIFAVEGGYVNDPSDPGGETNHGITLAVAQAYGYTGKMKDLTKETASNIYISNYINKPGFGDIITLSPAVGQKVVDAGVNAGTYRSASWFQAGLNALSRGGVDYAKITVDGKIGDASITAYKALVNKRGKVKACELTLKMLDAQQTQHYVSLNNLSQYVPGWLDARIGNVPLEKCRE